ncbi:hypothetical protein MPH_00255 [Macrophomina phaseolina MS6]|uniref:Uncharacterized protein n=2 Tax=Macrophomina phaseolina TaxID=35725 RepID=K2SIV2_MACPH|nr:hypothetical protein MPH_00255 [Macrophomina phaseolina MS6]KAH7025545.1 hypothetical protein B0J12DRAFT_722179 [Macrophomina phaseolina]
MDARPQQRPRSKSGFSFKSEKSDKSHGSGRPKVKDLHETSAEKHKRHLSDTSKANPNAAMNEAQPIAAALEAPTLGSLRSIQHKDVDGSPIPEPDLSNPTRSRWERPLDTIRKFEAQIDGEYRRRTGARTEVESNADFSGYTSRRSSYYGGNGGNRYSNATSNGGYGGNGGYYAGRNPTSPRPAEDPYAPPPVAGAGRNKFGQRIQQELGGPPRPPMHGQGLYPSHSYQQSRDTVNTGFSNSSGEAWGNSTDPSSENSSIERMAPGQKQDMGEQYGFNGFGGNPIAEEYDYHNNYYDQHGYDGAPAVGNGHYDQNQAPPVPPHNGVNGVSKMGDGPPQQPIHAAPAPRPVANGDGEKRKSWFKRRFSKE